MSGRMSRHWRTIALFLVLGVIVNVSLAWAFAAVGSIDPSRTAEIVMYDDGPRQVRGTEPVSLEWPMTVAKRWPMPAERIAMRGRGTSWDRAVGFRQTGATRVEFTLAIARFGWPFRSMQWKNSTIFDGQQYQPPPIGKASIMLPVWLETFSSVRTHGLPARRQLPIEPIWLGFAINSLLFAASLWAILRGWGVLRRFVRDKRGQCPNCGYPVGTSPVCTECGQPVASRSVA